MSNCNHTWVMYQPFIGEAFECCSRCPVKKSDIAVAEPRPASKAIFGGLSHKDAILQTPQWLQVGNEIENIKHVMTLTGALLVPGIAYRIVAIDFHRREMTIATILTGYVCAVDLASAVTWFRPVPHRKAP